MTKELKKTNDYYELFEVSRGADPDEIRRAYERMRQIYAVDSLVTYGLYSIEELKAYSEQIETAFRILMDQEKRAEYDKTLSALPYAKQQKQAQEAKRKAETKDALAEKTKELAKDDSQEQTDEIEEQTAKAPVATHDEKEGAEETNSKDKKQQEATSEPGAELKPQSPKFEIDEETQITGMVLQQIRESADISLAEISETTKISKMNLRLIEKEDWGKLPAVVYLKGFLSLYAKCLKIDEKRVVKDMMARQGASLPKNNKGF